MGLVHCDNSGIEGEGRWDGGGDGGGDAQIHFSRTVELYYDTFTPVHKSCSPSTHIYLQKYAKSYIILSLMSIIQIIMYSHLVSSYFSLYTFYIQIF